MAIDKRLQSKLESLVRQHEELESRMADPDIISNPTEYQAVLKQAGQTGKVVGRYKAYQEAEGRLSEASTLLETESDPEMIELAKQEAGEAGESVETIGNEIDVKYTHELDTAPLKTILEVGYGLFLPGQGVEDSFMSDDIAHFAYAQGGVRF